MVKLTITPKMQLPGGSFFLDNDSARVFCTNVVSITGGKILLWDNDTDECIIHKVDTVNNYYDIVSA